MPKIVNGPDVNIEGNGQPPIENEHFENPFFHVRKGPNIGFEPNFHAHTTSNGWDYPGKRKPKSTVIPCSSWILYLNSKFQGKGGEFDPSPHSVHMPAPTPKNDQKWKCHKIFPDTVFKKKYIPGSVVHSETENTWKAPKSKYQNNELSPCVSDPGAFAQS